MGMFLNPLGHMGAGPGVTGTPSTQPSEVRAATATEATAGVLNSVYISPSTLLSSNTSQFASPPPLGSTTPNTVKGTTVTASAGNLSATQAASGLVLNPTIAAAGASPQTANGRAGQVTFSGVSIAAGATQSFVINNTSVAAIGTVILYGMVGATSGSALSIQSVTNVAGVSSTIVVENGTGATTSTANITFTFLVLN